MSDTTYRLTLTSVPVAWGHEDGDRWHAEGHWSDEAMLLAVLCEQISVAHVDTDDLAHLLYGTDQPWLAGNEWENAKRVNDLCGQVRRCWFRPDPDNDENMLRCDEGDEGATPWTEFVG